MSQQSGNTREPGRKNTQTIGGPKLRGFLMSKTYSHQSDLAAGVFPDVSAVRDE